MLAAIPFDKMRNFRAILTFLFFISCLRSDGQTDSVKLDLKRLSDIEFFKKYNFDEDTPSSEDMKITKLIWSLKQVRRIDESLRHQDVKTVTIIDNRPSKENPYYIIGHYQLLI